MLLYGPSCNISNLQTPTLILYHLPFQDWFYCPAHCKLGLLLLSSCKEANLSYDHVKKDHVTEGQNLGWHN